ncbi:TolB family protein [Planctomycetota bacterium]
MKKTSFSSTCGLMLGVFVCLLLPGQVTKGDFIYGEPTKVPNLNTAFYDCNPQISRDGLELYLNYSATGACPYDIWVSKRPTTKDPWPMPVKLEGPINSPGPERSPSLSADGLELYFSDGYPNVTGCNPNPGGFGHSDLWVSKRASKDDLWGAPENLGPNVNTAFGEDTPCISADGLELYFMCNSPGYPDIFKTTRKAKDAPWSTPVNLGTYINSSSPEYTPYISADGLSLFFSRGGTTPYIYVSRRATTYDPWGAANSFSPISSGVANLCLSYSDQDPTLYFSRGSNVFNKDFDIWQVEVIPIVDFNGDGFVDTLDVYELLDHWVVGGRSSPRARLYDIAPFPFGDGIVDEKDLLVLAEHMVEISDANDF